MASRFPAQAAGQTRRPLAAILLSAFALLSCVLLWVALDDLRTGLVFAAILSGSGAIALMAGRGLRRPRSAAPPDRTLLHDIVAQAGCPMALTDRSGRLVTANADYDQLAGGLSPAALDARLSEAARAAWRDGNVRLGMIEAAGVALAAEVDRCGLGGAYLLWRFRDLLGDSRTARAAAFISGAGGEMLGQAGILATLVDADGRIVTFNALFSQRAPEAAGRPIDTLLEIGENGLARFLAGGEPAEGGAHSLRLTLLPVEPGPGPETGSSILLLAPGGPRPAAASPAAPIQFHELLGMLPLGLALVDRDGRLQFMNNWFRSAAGIPGAHTPVYPSELVIAEDAAAVSEAVRRASTGRSRNADLAVRLSHRPDEPVALTVAAVKGIGDTMVLLSLKDNEEESRLKRQVAQATKMQAVGQLAGGVAHDFNNILTGILGHCDLMLMRHAPGDSDYDDIQQIKHNANRAASLTRQLLAFSRQQTLRPQVLQLPDVISEISNLLKRLLGETVTLEVKHGRTLGAVRADPGQLEQVIVNLAVNARDAMPQGGRLTLQTYSVSMEEAQAIENDILPAADYTALGVSDTGAGIPPEIIGKIFEPFFTTKEVGKGTGLGLSTVYGIVKQTGGYIFAESEPGKGATFTLYLPVHHGDAQPDAVPEAVRANPQELWGSGTILLVEDEAMVRAVAERALSRQGYQVLTATNGEEALEQLDRCADEGVRVDLLISDVVMPVMDGPALGQKAREKFPKLPILFMSGYAEEQLRNSIDIDDVAFLPKPFSVQQLGEAARSAIAAEGADPA